MIDDAGPGTSLCAARMGEGDEPHCRLERQSKEWAPESSTVSRWDSLVSGMLRPIRRAADEWCTKVSKPRVQLQA